MLFLFFSIYFLFLLKQFKIKLFINTKFNLLNTNILLLLMYIYIDYYYISLFKKNELNNI